MMKIDKMMVGAVTLFSAFGLSSPAFSGDNDTKMYPGSMCVRYVGAHSANTSLNFSAIGNPSNRTLYVDCPVIHDEDGDGTLSAWYRAIDASNVANVRCGLNSFFRSGSTWLGWWTPVKQTSGFGSHVQHVRFTKDLGANGVSHYYFSCSIPPRYHGHTSYITSYAVRED